VGVLELISHHQEQAYFKRTLWPNDEIAGEWTDGSHRSATSSNHSAAITR
jgi:hypothetical protein